MQPCPTKLPVKQAEKTYLSTLIPCDEVFKIIKTKQNLAKSNYLDLYTIGEIWVGALSTALVGEKVHIFPVVKAAKPEGPPKKPSPMKYQDLPIYESPHSNYKEQQIEKCPDANVKLLHRFLYPHVKYCRQALCSAACNLHGSVVENYKSAKNTAEKKKEELIQTLRDPKNLEMRYGIVAGSGLAGYLMGIRNNRRILYTTLGLLAAGALTFPKETDEIFRNVVFYTRKTFMDLYTTLTGNDLNIREKGACRNELPPPPENRANVSKICPKDK